MDARDRVVTAAEPTWTHAPAPKEPERSPDLTRDPDGRNAASLRALAPCGPSTLRMCRSEMQPWSLIAAKDGAAGPR